MKRTITILTAALVLFVSFMVCAQDSAPAAGASVEMSAPAAPTASVKGAEEVEHVLTLRSIFVKGGWVMYGIAALSFVAIALTFFYILTMRAGVLFPKRFILEAQDAAENNDIEALKDLCAENTSPSARIIAASLEAIVPGQPLNYDRLRDAMEDEGARQANALWQRLQYLMDVAVISPMVGLLGTVWGMMISFGGIENGAEFAKKAETLASGISQAMNTTFGGLIVGIFAMALYDIFRGRLNRLIGSMESSCGSVLRCLAPAGASKGAVRQEDESKAKEPKA